MNVPLSGLLHPAFAATRRCLIGNRAATSPVAAGSPFAPFSGCSGAPASTQSSSASPAAHHTNSIVTEDKWGDVVAYTNTINFFGCSGQVVGGYGFLLNDELTDFDFAPSWSGAYDPNLPTAGKEPRSSMGPVIALRNGRPQFAIGAAGGSTIITTVVQILMNRVNFGMGLPAALAENFSLATGSILPLDNYPGDATALQMMGHGRAEAIAEPVRLGGGGALAVNPSPG